MPFISELYPFHSYLLSMWEEKIIPYIFANNEIETESALVAISLEQNLTNKTREYIM